MMLLLSMYMVVKIAAGQRSVPGNPIYLPLLIAAAMLLWKLVGGIGDITYSKLGSMMDVSAIYQVGLFALGVLLVQALAASAPLAGALLGISGAAMMAGGMLAWSLAGGTPSATAMLPVMIAGLGVVFATGMRSSGGGRFAGIIGAGAIVALVIASIFGPVELLPASSAAGLVVAAGALFLQRRRLALCALGAFSAIVAFGRMWRNPPFDPMNITMFGHGEGVFNGLNASNWGLELICGALGWAGTVVLAAGILAAAVWIVIITTPPCRPTTLLLVGCAIFATSSLLLPGGLFLPACTLSSGTCWAFAGSRLRPDRPYGAAAVAMSLGALTLLLGVVGHMGLAISSAFAFSLTDRFLHIVAGFLSTLAICWLLGAKRLWLGLVAIVIGASLGGLGEWLQSLASRSPEMRDWLHHIFGSFIAGVTFILGRCSVFCESHESTHNNKPPAAYDQFPT